MDEDAELTSTFQPWLGQAERIDAIGKEILKYYTQRVVMVRVVVEDGTLKSVPKIKYKTIYETHEREMTDKGFNPTRLGEHLLKSDKTPRDIKEVIAKKMKSKFARDYLAKIESNKRILEKAEDTAIELKQTNIKHQAIGTAAQRDEDRQLMITKYIARDAVMPDEIAQLAMYFLSICIYMCRLPFSIVTNPHFRRFLRAVRPNFEKRFSSHTRDVVAGPMLDEAYEECQIIVQDALAAAPGKVTVGMDGHKDGKKRHVETITKAKLGVSTFAGAEYFGTKSVTGATLASIATRYVTPGTIALVADNTGMHLSIAHT